MEKISAALEAIMENRSIVKVLQVTIGDGSFGGVTNFLYTFYSHMDHQKVHSDFLYCGENSMQSKIDDPMLSESHITTLHILKRNNNGFKEYCKLLPALIELFGREKYNIVHINSSNLFMNVCVAHALQGRAKLISHSHNTQATIQYSPRFKQIVKDLIRKPCQRFIISKADAMFACSRAAGENLFGAKGILNDKFKVINNAIDARKYEFSVEKRECLRRGYEDALIVGFVGRLTDQKNPFFVIDIFREIQRRDNTAILWVVGEGELKEQVEVKIKEEYLEKQVKLLGRRGDVPDLMQAMDLFLAPSLYEGLSIVCVEAQAASLPVFASEVIPEEANLTDLITRISLDKTASEWADIIVSSMNQRPNRTSTYDSIVSAGFDINEEALKLERTYCSLMQTK